MFEDKNRAKWQIGGKCKYILWVLTLKKKKVGLRYNMIHHLYLKSEGVQCIVYEIEMSEKKRKPLVSVYIFTNTTVTNEETNKK